MFLLMATENIHNSQLTLINCFACNRDPAAFDDPENFIPERWMNGHHGRTDTADHGAEKLGVPHLTYGAGRRVCPGIDSEYLPLLF